VSITRLNFNKKSQLSRIPPAVHWVIDPVIFRIFMTLLALKLSRMSIALDRISTSLHSSPGECPEGRIGRQAVPATGQPLSGAVERVELVSL